MPLDPKAVTDSAIVAAAVTSPAWAYWLGNLNLVVTVCTLIVGLALGVSRLWLLWRDDRRTDRDRPE